MAYKKQYFNGHLLLEGAIIAELTQLLSAKLEYPLRLKCEVQYKHIHDRLGEQIRTDLAIGHRENDVFIIDEVIEVKRYEVNKKKDNMPAIGEDIEKLYLLNETYPRPKLYLLLVGQHKLPTEFFGPNGGMKTNNWFIGGSKIEVKPVMSKKALNQMGYGAFSLLLEVDHK